MNNSERIEVTAISRDMNELKSQMNRMWKHSNELTQAVSKTTAQVEKLSDLLQDDDRSTDKGILTRLNELESNVDRLLSVSERLEGYGKAAKKFFWWILSIVAGLIIALVKVGFYS